VVVMINSALSLGHCVSYTNSNSKICLTQTEFCMFWFFLFWVNKCYKLW